MIAREPTLVRAWFADAAAAFVDAVDRLPADLADGPALGEWTMRSLVGHTCRTFIGVEEYSRSAHERRLSGQDVLVEVDDAVDYFRRAFASVGDPAAVAARGVDSGRALGPAPFDTAHDLAVRGIAFVDAAPDDGLVDTPVGTMTLLDYLVTRAFELSVHTLDIVDAAGIAPPPTLAACARRAAAFAVTIPSDADALTALRALTGRAALPDGFTALR